VALAVLAAVVSFGGTAGIAARYGPDLIAACVIRVIRRLIFERDMLRDIGRLALVTSQEADEEIAGVVWSAPMRAGLQDSLVSMCSRPDFMDAIAGLVTSLSRDRSLKDTIREGVLEALQDQHLKAEIKAIIIDGLSDEDMRSALLRSAISSVKTGIAEAVEDTELKEVLSAAIRDAFQDPRLSGVLRGALKEALADQELHRATFQGAVSALNPFKRTPTKSEGGGEVETSRSPGRSSDSPKEHQPSSSAFMPFADWGANTDKRGRAM